ncbi:MAG: MATE family efflux transporter [Ruminococcaceae bacterium]|nr:MATE family efflux transporter [Oscillospiraceae bacterium]
MLPTILILAWPTMLEQLLQTAVQYIDTAMVGSIGDYATAAVGSTTTVNWLVNSTIQAIGIGFLAYIAQAHGARDGESVRRASAQAVLTTLVTGALFTVITLALSSYIPLWMQVDGSISTLAAQYFFIIYAPMLPRTATIIFGAILRAVGDTKTPMLVGLTVNILNVLLNFFLIFDTRQYTVFSHSFTVYGAGLGVIGAAIASAVAFTAGGILITVALWRHKDLSPRGRSIKPDFHVLRPCMRIALPNMLQRFGTCLGYVAFASMINSLGDISTAAHTIANTVESAFYIPGYGMQAAASTLTGNALGAKDGKRMKELARLLVLIEVALMIVSGALLFIFAPQMAGIFSDSPEVISLAATVLQMVAVSEPIFGAAIIIEGLLHGVGKTAAPFIFNIIGMWGIRIVGTFICTQLFSLGLISAWACMIGHNLLLFIMFLAYYLSGKWNPLNNGKNSINIQGETNA